MRQAKTDWTNLRWAGNGHGLGIGWAVRWLERWRQRRVLEELEPRLLADIGIDRVDAVRECDKPFWMK